MKGQISETEKAYFAGLFDGEGTVGIRKNNEGYRVEVGFGITYMPILEIMRDVFGGHITPHPKKANRKQLYEWDLGGRNAYDFLVVVRPYIHEKKPQVELAIQYCEEFGLGAGIHRKKYEKVRQEWYYQESRRLKTVEYASAFNLDMLTNIPEQLRLVE